MTDKSSRTWLAFIIIVAIGGTSWMVAKNKASNLEGRFIAQCNAQHATSSCERTTELYHTVCTKKATPSRRNSTRGQLLSDAPDPQKYMTCMMKEVKSRAYQDRQQAQRNQARRAP